MPMSIFYYFYYFIVFCIVLFCVCVFCYSTFCNIYIYILDTNTNLYECIFFPLLLFFDSLSLPSKLCPLHPSRDTCARCTSCHMDKRTLGHTSAHLPQSLSINPSAGPSPVPSSAALFHFCSFTSKSAPTESQLRRSDGGKSIPVGR